MTCCGDNLFKGVTNYSDTDFLNELVNNMMLFLNHGFLRIGAWQDVVPYTAICDEDLYTLSLLKQPAKNLGYYQWVSPRKQWAWESVVYNSSSPLSVIIYHNDIDVTSDFTINYNLGLVTTTTKYTGDITAQYSYRTIQVYNFDKANWWHEFIYNAYGVHETSRSVEDLVYPAFRNSGVQPPCIIVEALPSARRKGVQLGTAGHFVFQDMRFTVISYDATVRNKIISILGEQKDNIFKLFNTDTADFPIGCDGDVINSNEYLDIVNDNEWKCARITETFGSEIEPPCPGIHMGRVRMTVEVAYPTK